MMDDGEETSARNAATDNGEDRPSLDPSLPLALCPCCLSGNAPWWNFCHDCGAPQNFIAATAPFERVWATGFVIRSAVSRPWCRRILVGLTLLLMFPPMILFSIPLARLRLGPKSGV